MAALDDFQGHTKAYSIGEATCADIRAAWSILDSKMGDILSAFYKRWEREPKLASLVHGRVDHLKKAQYEHWKRLFSTRFDRDYFESVHRVGLAHVRIGLEPHYYISGYNYVLEQISSILGRSARLSGTKAARMVSAVTKAVLLDMDIAVSVYGETLIEQITERQNRTQVAIGEFDSQINSLLGKFGKMTSDLGTSSGELQSQAASVTDRCDSIRSSQETTGNGIATTAAATEELHASIGEIGRQAEASLAVSTKAVNGARQTARFGEGVVRCRRQDRFGGGADLLHRCPDQSSGPQCHHRGSSGRRGRQGVCRRRQRGEIACLADGEGHRGDHRPDRSHPAGDAEVGR